MTKWIYSIIKMVITVLISKRTLNTCVCILLNGLDLNQYDALCMSIQCNYTFIKGAALVQLVWWLIMGWAIPVSKPDGAQGIFSSPHPSRLALGPTYHPVLWVPVFFQALSSQGMTLTTHPIVPAWHVMGRPGPSPFTHLLMFQN
jgi:hypothetical protein